MQWLQNFKFFNILSLSQILGTGIIVLVMALNISAIPRLFREVHYYWKSGWKFTEVNGSSVILQDSLVHKYSFLPVGIIKIVVLTTQIWFFCAPLLAAWNGYLGRQ